MKNFVNNKNVNFKELEESGIYSKKLLQQIKKGNYKFLNESLSDTERKDRDFMEPLLYAVRNETRGSYEIYKFYKKTLQEEIKTNNDLTLAVEIINYKPELIRDTPLNDYEMAIIEGAKKRPEVVRYMADELKTDIIFIEQLCALQNKEVSLYAARECKVLDQITQDSSLASNPYFMKEAIKKDASLLIKANVSLKNNYEFIKEVSNKNYEVVGYIIDNEKQFGIEAIRGAKDTTKRLTVENSKAIINDMAQISDDARYEKVAKKLEERGKNNKYETRWATAMVAQSGNVTPEYFRQVFDDSILAMLGIKKDLTEDGKEKVSVDNTLQMVTPQILNKLKTAAIKNGLKVDQNLEKRLEEYTEFFYSYREKLKAEKRNNIKGTTKEIMKIEPTNIENVSEESQLSEIQAETAAIREEIIAERENKVVEAIQINENNELGEQE